MNVLSWKSSETVISGRIYNYYISVSKMMKYDVRYPKLSQQLIHLSITNIVSP